MPDQRDDRRGCWRQFRPDTRHDASVRTLGYDDRNRLVSIDDGGGSLGTYLYNALGQRVIKTAGGTTSHFHYDQNGQLIAESDNTGAVLREYLFANGTLVGLINIGNVATGEYIVDDDDGAFSGEGQWESFADAQAQGGSYQRHRHAERHGRQRFHHQGPARARMSLRAAASG